MGALLGPRCWLLIQQLLYLSCAVAAMSMAGVESFSATSSNSGPSSDPSCGICPGNGVAAEFYNASLGANVNPVGNSFTTKSAFVLQGDTGVPIGREFLATIGLRSTRGAAANSTPYRDKVALYVAAEGHNGTGDLWAINPLVTQEPGSGDYTAQGIELDFNNNNAHRGDADAGAGLAPPSSYALSLTGAGAFRSTAAMLLSGPGTHPIWNRGIVVANDCVAQADFQSLGSPNRSIDIRGNPGYGVYQASPKSKNHFAGGTGFGVQPTGRATVEVSGNVFISMGALDVDLPSSSPSPSQSPPQTPPPEGKALRGLKKTEVKATAASSTITHSALLAPGERLLVFRGTARLDDMSRANITLSIPGLGSAWAFASTSPSSPSPSAAADTTVNNRLSSATYSLTAIGRPMPELHVYFELQPTAPKRHGMACFGIAAGARAAGLKVSWTLTVPRVDDYDMNHAL